MQSGQSNNLWSIFHCTCMFNYTGSTFLPSESLCQLAVPRVPGGRPLRPTGVFIQARVGLVYPRLEVRHGTPYLTQPSFPGALCRFGGSRAHSGSSILQDHEPWSWRWALPTEEGLQFAQPWLSQPLFTNVELHPITRFTAHHETWVSLLSVVVIKHQTLDMLGFNTVVSLAWIGRWEQWRGRWETLFAYQTKLLQN